MLDETKWNVSRKKDKYSGHVFSRPSSLHLLKEIGVLSIYFMFLAPTRSILKLGVRKRFIILNKLIVDFTFPFHRVFWKQDKNMQIVSYSATNSMSS